jgi:hypothetical protein
VNSLSAGSLKALGLKKKLKVLFIVKKETEKKFYSKTGEYMEYNLEGMMWLKSPHGICPVKITTSLKSGPES